MTAIRKLFTETNMSWKLVIVLSVLCGVIPGLLMVPEQLSGTSLRMPGTTFEFWVFAGLFISLNCKKPLDAGLKVFVFFLISQPLIYLVQVPFDSMGWGLFSYYPLWAAITVLTFPAGMLANLITRGKWWSILILLIPLGILITCLTSSIVAMIATFPKMSLTCLFIIAQLLLFPAVLVQGKSKLAATYALITAMVAASTAIYILSGSGNVESSTPAQGTEPYVLVSDKADAAEVSVENGMIAVTYHAVLSRSAFTIPIEYEDAEGNVYRLTFTKTADDSGFFSEIERE